MMDTANSALSSIVINMDMEGHLILLIRPTQT